ncbi:MAG: DUF4287 domain-containing protein [Planctomycetota bacterium]
MANTADEQLATMIKNLEEKTGRKLAAWTKLVLASGAAKHGEMVAWLKTEHGMTHGYANLVAHEARKTSPAGPEAVAKSKTTGATKKAAGSASEGRELYTGPKEGLLPIHDELLKLVRTFGKDVELAPKKTYVSLRRATQFGCIQPSTKTRVDLGIKLKGVEPTGKLEASGSWNTMVTHRVRLESVKDIDAKVRGWLKKAYEQAG